jgi:SAM-dependent methyltransferase
MIESTYLGTELESFALAQNWKSYISEFTRKYITGHVLDVGSGIGGNIGLIGSSNYRSCLCLEPDIALFNTLKKSIKKSKIDNFYAKNGAIDELNIDQFFDSVLYLDVLEHIFEDKEEIIKASSHLRENGHLIVLAPAHQCLFTPFDQAIGHYRRYSKSTLMNLLPVSVELIKLLYLDSVGILAILANKFILRQQRPTEQQIISWDSLMIPVSRRLDRIIRYKLGKSVLLVGRKKR